ncbi:MAG TPA: hypothetical protein VK427_20735, partial [Kofleriaceae bacterium]|nr:hypothetical protein [Kofleriaceae bacterium]
LGGAVALEQAQRDPSVRAAPENRDFERAERGDVISVGDAPGDERVEITGPLTRSEPAKR